MAKKIRIQAELDDSKLRQQLNDLGKKPEKITVDIGNGNIDGTTGKLRNLHTAVSNSNSIFSKLKSTISNTFSGSRIALTAYIAALNEINKAARNAKATINDMDEAVTNLSIAMGKGRNEAYSYLGELNKQAKELGATTKETADSADSWIRQGKSIAETEQLVRDSMVLSKLGKIESADASEYLTASLNGYKKSASEAIDIVDKLTAVDMESASDAGGLAVSLSKTASAANMAGVSFDRLVGMVATVKEVTQDSDESVGNMFKSIFSRMNQIKAGKFIDAETGEALNDVEKVLNKVGIAMRDANGEFISSEKIIDDVGSKWESFDSTTQRAVATAMAGTYQYNKLIALFENYSKALQYTEVATDSAGTAMQKFNDSYLGSLEAKQNTLQASFESMVMNTDFSEVYGGILDATTALIDFINQTNALKGAMSGLAVAGGIKAFLTIKTGVTEAYIALNKFQNALDITKKVSISTSEYEKLLLLSNGLSASQMKLVLSTNSLTLAQKQELLMASGLSAEEAALQLETWGMTAANTGLTASTVSLGAALKGLWATMIANPIIMLTTLTSAAVMAYQTYKQHVVEAAEATKEAIETFESISSEVEALEGKLSDLNEQINQLDPITDAEDIENLQLETEELEKQLAILKEKQRIAESDADKAAQKSLGMTEASRYKTEERESAYGGVESGAAYVTKDEELQNAIEAYEKYKAKVDEANDALANMAKTGDYTKEEWKEQEQIVSTYSEKMEDARAHANELAVSLDEQKQGLNGSTDASQTLLTKIEGVITQYDQWLKKINGTTEALEEQAEAEEEVSETAKSISFEQAWADSFTSESEAVKKLGDDLLGLAEKGRLSKRAFEEVDSNAGGYFKNLGISADEAVDRINKLVDEAKQLSSMSSQISSMAEALGTKKENGFVDADTLAGFDVEVRGLDSWDRFQEVLGSTTSSYKECQEAANALATEWVNSGDFLAQLTEQNEEYYKTQLKAMGVENYEEVISYAQSLNEAKSVLAQTSLELGQATQDEIEALIQEGTYSEQTANMILALYDAKLAQQATTIDTAADCENLIALAGDANKTSQTVQLLIELMNLYNMMESDTYKTSRTIQDYVAQRASEIKAQIDAIANGETDGIEIEPTVKLGSKGKSSARKAGKDIKDILKEQLSDLEGVISGITSRIDDQISSVNEQKSAALESIDAQKEALEEAKDAAVESLEAERDARLEVIETQKAQLEEQIKLIDKQIKSKQDEIKSIEDAAAARAREISLQEKQYALEQKRNQRTKLVYTESSGMIYRPDEQGIRKAKEEVDEAKRQIEIANIQKEIDLLEDQKDLLSEQITLLDEQADAITKYYDEQIKQTEKFYDAQIKNLEKQRKEVEAYYSSLTKSLEQRKEKFQELTEILEKAELSAKLKQLGIDEEALLNGSEEEFEKLKNAYMNIVMELNKGNDDVLNALRDLPGYEGTAPSVLEESNDKLGTMNDELGDANGKVDKVNSSLTETASTTGTVATNVGTVVDGLNELPDSSKISGLSKEFEILATKIGEVAKALGIGEGEATSTLLQAMSNLNTVTLGNEGEGIIGQFTLLKNAITDVIDTIGSTEAQTVGSLMSAIAQLNSISLDETIITQFNNLETAINQVTAAISGGSGEPSEGASSGGESGSKGGKQGGSGGKGGKGSEGESGGGNSLTGAIESMGETAKEVIGEPDAEGDGTVIGEFGSMETAVNDVRDAIGTEGGEGEGGGSGSGGETDDTLVGSIEYLGDKTEEEMGESGGDGIIGRFEEFRDVIGEADEHVKSISDGLDNIDGKEVSCTIKINIIRTESGGGGGDSAAGESELLGSMNMNSATYNAQYKGNAHYEGTAKVTGDWGVKEGGKTLCGEMGQEIVVRGSKFFTVGDNGAEFVNLQKGDLVFNHLQTKELLSKGNIVGRGRALASGTALANGTSNNVDDSIWTTLADGTRVRDLQPGDKMYDMMQKFDAYFNSMDGNLEKLVPNSVYEHQRQMEDMAKQINYVSSVVNNNRNVQQPVNQTFNITMPNVTDSTSAASLMNDLQSLATKKYQVDW